MRLEIQTSLDGNSATITLEGKSIAVERTEFGAQMDCRALPESAGKATINQLLGTVYSLMQIEEAIEIISGMMTKAPKMISQTIFSSEGRRERERERERANNFDNL